LKNVDAWVRFLRSAPDSTTSTVPYPLTQFVKDNSNGVLAAVILEYQSSIAWGRAAEEQIDALFVSSNWFDEVGYGAESGRVLSDRLDGAAGAPVAVVSHA